MNIYVIMKRTFDTEERIQIETVPLGVMVLSILLILMTNTPSRKQSL